jgi:iron complex outermembrane receptor protein
LLEEYYSATNVAPGEAFVQLPPNSAAAKDLGLPGGLQPEKSTNLSVGAVFRPISKLTATLDLYQILVTNRIVGSGSVFGEYLGDTWSPAVNNAIAANGSAGAVAGAAFTGVNVFTNGFDTRTRGADLTLEFPAEYDWGKIDWSLNATYNSTVVTRIPGTPASVVGGIHDQSFFTPDIVSDLETASPRFVLNLGGLWTYDKFSVNLREIVYGASSEQGGDNGFTNGVTTVYYKTTIGVSPITDLDLGYQATQHLRIGIGANNLFNRYPNRENSTLIGLFDKNLFFAGVEKYPDFSAFGTDGGFYYIKATYTF